MFAPLKRLFKKEKYYTMNIIMVLDVQELFPGKCSSKNKNKTQINSGGSEFSKNTLKIVYLK